MIYLDHNATTPVLPEVLEAMLPWFGESFGNASAVCEAARPAREAVARGRTCVAELLGASEDEVVFTGSGTESDNAALASAWHLQPECGVLVIGATEHSAVHQCAQRLVETREGAKLVQLPVDEAGVLKAEVLENCLREAEGGVAMVSIHWANNETGVIQPIADLGEVCAAHEVPFHVDAVQAAGKIPLNLANTRVDFASFSAHKLGGPQGVGALYIRRGLRFSALIQGGGQEGGRRSGTINVAGVVGFGEAAKQAQHWLQGERPAELALQRDFFEREVQARVKGLAINGDGTARLPNTSNLRFPGSEGEALRIALDTLGLCCSVGSACKSTSLDASKVLIAMGLDRLEAKSSLRFSLGRSTTKEEIERAIAAVEEAVSRAGKAPGRGLAPVKRSVRRNDQAEE